MFKEILRGVMAGAAAALIGDKIRTRRANRAAVKKMISDLGVQVLL